MSAAASAAVDTDVVEELFRSAYPKLAGWVSRLVDPDTAHEIASEAFVRLLSRRIRLDSPQRYLYVVAMNLIRDHWRRAGREQQAVRRATTISASHPVSYPTLDVEVRSLIGSLPARLSGPFLLHYYGDFGIREVAALLRRPEGTVKADLFAARARLKLALAESGG